jgi:hypothetical protein
MNKDTEGTVKTLSGGLIMSHKMRRNTHFDAKTPSINIVAEKQIRIVVFKITSDFKQFHQIVLAAQS